MKSFLNAAIAGLVAVIVSLSVSGYALSSSPSACPVTDPYCYEDNS